MKSIYIVLVNYKNFEDTIECVKSLRTINNYDKYKVIIVDNASNNNSVIKIKNSLKECLLIESKYNIGFAGGNNLGIKYALKHSADFVLLLNNDTVVERDFLDRLLEVYEKNDNVGIVGGKIYYYYDRNRIWYAGGKINKFIAKTKHIGLNKIDKGQYDCISKTEYVTGCMMLVSRTAIERCGFMDEKFFLYYEETDWNIRIKDAGFKIMYTPLAKIYHKVSATTGKSNLVMSYYYDRNRYYFVTKNFNCIYKLSITIYIVLRLYFKLLKALMLKDTKSKKMVIKTMYSIRNKIMGEIQI
ncbi:glycosyltransferase family 2 protein [Clostridium felsineum]|uniref:glycosyltransferase family 2 protein n=1 Tax=Clostridium felsineum TaxID=36839 RepID=UPI00214DD000|nr:glycosyltransferase family 2 protein [Clostridium felsineum]MCR3757948.1 glycosyltransferase family 2 protein [Clostridium felsineum]